MLDDKCAQELVKCAKAQLLLQIQAAAGPEDQQKVEVLLDRAGFTAREIAGLLGKKESAVSKAIQRAGKAA